MNDQMLVQYLLSRLGPEDTERLDEASMVDDEIAARLRTVEHDLVDAYVRGSLTGETLTRFESHYLASPRRRENVAFARRFVPAIDRTVASRESEAKRRSTPSILLRASMLAAAAALVLVVSGVLLLQSGRGPRVAPSPQAALGQQARELEPALDPRGKLVDDTAAATATESVRAPATTPVLGVQRVPPVALLLLPQTRSIRQVPAVSIPAGADRLGLELRLDSNEFPRYQVGLRDPAVNTIVWRSGWTEAKSPAGEPSVRVGIPAGVLKPQHYSLDLNGRRPGGGAEVVGSYVFEIVPP